MVLRRNRGIASPGIPGLLEFSSLLRGWSCSTPSINILAMRVSLCVFSSLGSPFISCFAAAQGVRPVPNKLQMS